MNNTALLPRQESQDPNTIPTRIRVFYRIFIIQSFLFSDLEGSEIQEQRWRGRDRVRRGRHEVLDSRARLASLRAKRTRGRRHTETNQAGIVRHFG